MNASNRQRNEFLMRVVSLCLGMAVFARGQTPGASDDLPALRVAVTSVNESRNSLGQGSTINLALSVMGEGLPANAVVKQVTVTKAVDNLGNVLGSLPEPLQSMYAQRSLSLRAGRGGMGQLTGMASLIAPVRRAESVQYVEGAIELHLPFEAKGSTIRIPNVLNHPGRIVDPALARHGIEFHFLPNQASYDEAKDRVAGFQAGARPPDFTSSVGYFLRDPAGRLTSHQLQDAKGNVIPTNGTSWNGGNGSRTGTIPLQAPLPADAQLVFFLAIPEAIKTVPFRVEDIALP